MTANQGSDAYLHPRFMALEIHHGFLRAPQVVSLTCSLTKDVCCLLSRKVCPSDFGLRLVDAQLTHSVDVMLPRTNSHPFDLAVEQRRMYTEQSHGYSLRQHAKSRVLS